MHQRPYNRLFETMNKSCVHALSIFGVPVDRETIFCNHKGVYKSKIEKRQRKLIVKTTQISNFLLPGERIFCLTTCYSPITVFEQVITGPSFLYFKRAVLIFTDRRILHIPTNFNLTPHSAVSQIMYEDCARISMAGRSLEVLYKNRQIELFLYIGRKEKKKIRVLVDQLPVKPKEAGRLQQRVYLCPGCAVLLKKGTHSCPTCKMAFKTSQMALFLSLLTPGGGYFYSRHPVVGMLNGLTEMLTTALIIFYALNLNILPISTSLFVLSILTYAVCKIVGVYHSRQLVSGFMPKEENFIFPMNSR